MHPGALARKLTTAITDQDLDEGLRRDDFLHIATTLADDPPGDAGRALRDGATVLLDDLDADSAQPLDDYVAELLASAAVEAGQYPTPQQATRFTNDATEAITRWTMPITDGRFIMAAHWIGSLDETPAAAALHNGASVQLRSDDDEPYWIPVGELLIELLADAAARSTERTLDLQFKTLEARAFLEVRGISMVSEEDDGSITVYVRGGGEVTYHLDGRRRARHLRPLDRVRLMLGRPLPDRWRPTT